MLKTLVFLVALINQLNGLLNVTDEFLFCTNASKRLNTDELSHDIRMKIKLNYANLAKNEDEFHLIRGKTNLFIVYSNQNRLFETECISVQQIIIQDILTDTTCFKDLYIAYFLDGSLNKAFLTKSGVLRRQTREIKCTDSQQIFNSISNNFQVIKLNKNVSASFFFNAAQKYENQIQNKTFLALACTTSSSHNVTKNTTIENLKLFTLVSEEKNSTESLKHELVGYEQIQLFLISLFFLLWSIYRAYQSLMTNCKIHENKSTVLDFQAFLNDLSNQINVISEVQKQNEINCSSNLNEFKTFWHAKNEDFESSILTYYKKIQSKIEEVLPQNQHRPLIESKSDSVPEQAKSNNALTITSDSDSGSTSTSETSQSSGRSRKLKSERKNPKIQMPIFSAKRKSDLNNSKKNFNYK